MEIEILANKVRINTSQDIGSAFIAAGIARQYVPFTSAKGQDLYWGVSRGQIVGDVEEPPAIHFNCRSCGNNGKGSPSPERLTHQDVRCPSGCAGIGNPPPHIRQMYLELRAAFVTRKAPRRVR